MVYAWSCPLCPSPRLTFSFVHRSFSHLVVHSFVHAFWHSLAAVSCCSFLYSVDKSPVHPCVHSMVHSHAGLMEVIERAATPKTKVVCSVHLCSSTRVFDKSGLFCSVIKERSCSSTRVFDPVTEVVNSVRVLKSTKTQLLDPRTFFFFWS